MFLQYASIGSVNGGLTGATKTNPRICGFSGKVSSHDNYIDFPRIIPASVPTFSISSPVVELPDATEAVKTVKDSSHKIELI